LRSLPPPWLVPGLKVGLSNANGRDSRGTLPPTASTKSVLDVLVDLPPQCLMAYYESRRRWIFGGQSLTTRGLRVEGVCNGGSNIQSCGGASLLAIAGVGVSTLNDVSTARMGDYKERLVLSRSPIVGYGSNDNAGVASTTAADGSPIWSVDDSALPVTFFDGTTGEFKDSVHARSLSKIMVNFGNPFREQRASSLIPQKFLSHAPSMQRQEAVGSDLPSPGTPPGSPPHSSFDSVEEGEAIFVTRVSPLRSSPKHEESNDPGPARKRLRVDSIDETNRLALPSTGADFVDSNTFFPRPSPPIASKSVKPPIPSAETAQTAGKQPPKPSRPAPVIRKQTVLPGPGLTKGMTAPHHRPPPPPPKPKSIRNVPTAAGSTEQAIDTLTTAAKRQQPPSGEHTDTALEVLREESPRIDLETPDKPPDVLLPSNWVCVWSKSQKRWYFFDTKTNTSVWKWPPDS
jgi:hypothetical protein